LLLFQVVNKPLINKDQLFIGGSNRVLVFLYAQNLNLKFFMLSLNLRENSNSYKNNSSLLNVPASQQKKLPGFKLMGTCTNLNMPKLSVFGIFFFTKNRLVTKVTEACAVNSNSISCDAIKNLKLPASPTERAELIKKKVDVCLNSNLISMDPSKLKGVTIYCCRTCNVISQCCRNDTLLKTNLPRCCENNRRRAQPHEQLYQEVARRGHEIVGAIPLKRRDKTEFYCKKHGVNFSCTREGYMKGEYIAPCCIQAATAEAREARATQPVRPRVNHWRHQAAARNWTKAVRAKGRNTCVLTGAAGFRDTGKVKKNVVEVHHIWDGDSFSGLRSNVKNGILLHTKIHLHYHNKFLSRNQKPCNPETLLQYVKLLQIKAAENSSCEFGVLGKLIKPELLGNFLSILNEAKGLNPLL
jgi:hypothetical protein